MKTSITTIAKIAGGLGLLAASSMAMASVTNTPHNLSSSQTTGMHVSGANATTEICIFCHTPHGGDQSVNAPLWNRSVSSTSVYTRFSSMGRLTFDAKEAPVGSVSIACLSCHDGTQARDAVINGPGSGNNNNLVGTDGNASTFFDGTNPTGRALSDLVGSDNGILNGDLIYIGTDLRNDHPISMQYGGGGIDSTHTNRETVDPDFSQVDGSGTGSYRTLNPNAQNHATNSVSNPPATVHGVATGVVVYQANNAQNDGGPLWYIDTGTAGYQATDFPLYTRDEPTVPGGPQPFVECGTCHDPHSANSTFLRLPGGNHNSSVCLTCHAK